jgi:hypothetical protein
MLNCALCWQSETRVYATNILASIVIVSALQITFVISVRLPSSSWLWILLRCHRMPDSSVTSAQSSTSCVFYWLFCGIGFVTAVTYCRHCLATGQGYAWYLLLFKEQQCTELLQWVKQTTCCYQDSCCQRCSQGMSHLLQLTIQGTAITYCWYKSPQCFTSCLWHV